MHQKELPAQIICSSCSARNDPRDRFCWNCEDEIFFTTEKNNLKLFKQKTANQPKKIVNRDKIISLVVVGLGILAVVGGVGYLLSSRTEREVVHENISTLNNNRPQLEGRIFVWIAPSTEKYLSLVGKALSNNGKFDFFQMNISRDPLEELKQGVIDLVILDRPRQSKIKEIEDLGYKVTTDVFALNVIVYTANKEKTGVSSLNFHQIQDIYRGKIINWNQVGGKNLPITPILLSKDNFLGIEFNNRLNPNVKFAKNTSSAIKALNHHEGGLFYLPSSTAIKTNGIEILSIENKRGTVLEPFIEIDGKKQLNETALIKENYPFVELLKIVYLDRGRTFETVSSERITEFINSSSGHEILRRSGYIPKKSGYVSN